MRILRYPIESVAENRDTFIFSMELVVPCILHIENRISEKMVVIILLEILQHHTTGTGAEIYFKELEPQLKNIILAEKNDNWDIPTKGDALKNISL